MALLSGLLLVTWDAQGLEDFESMVCALTHVVALQGLVLTLEAACLATVVISLEDCAFDAHPFTRGW